MGLEDYRVILKPGSNKAIFPDDRSVLASGKALSQLATAEEIARVLETLGFVRQSRALQVGPARPAVPAATEMRLTARRELPDTARQSGADGEYIVEALIRGHEQARGGDLVFDSLSMRFAICQPEGAAWHFLKMVKRMCDRLSLAVVQGEKTYSPEVFWAFRLRANEQIRNQQALWREIFKGDSEQLPIAVEDTWGHFLRKHPELRDTGDRTAITRASARKRCADADFDIEETLPPNAVKPVPVRRNARS
jgi:hypothetical protein